MRSSSRSFNWKSKIWREKSLTRFQWPRSTVTERKLAKDNPQSQSPKLMFHLPMRNRLRQGNEKEIKLFFFWWWWLKSILFVTSQQISPQTNGQKSGTRYQYLETSHHCHDCQKCGRRFGGRFNDCCWTTQTQGHSFHRPAKTGCSDATPIATTTPTPTTTTATTNSKNWKYDCSQCSL